MATNKELEATQELNIVPSSEMVFGRRMASFEKMVDERETLRAEETSAKEQRGYSDNGERHPGIDDKIKSWLGDVGKVLLSDGRKVQVVERGGNEFYDEKLLLQYVPAATLAKCKRRGRSSWHILVTYPKPQR